MRIHHLALLLLALGVGGCNRPHKWAEAAELELRCDMSLDELQTLTNRAVTQLDVPIGWTTHMIQDDGTQLRLGVADGKLKWAQIAWTARPTRMATYQRIDFCGLEPGNPEVVHPIINQ